MKENYKEIIESNGFTFKNYKVMCEELGEPVLTSNSKNKQMKDWLCYFDFHKEKQKIIIDSVKEFPEEIPDRKRRIRSDFILWNRELLFNKILKEREENGNSYFIGCRKDYYLSLSYCSPLYLSTRYDKLDDVRGKLYDNEKLARLNEFLNVYKVTDTDYYNFCFLADDVMRQSLRNSFKSLCLHNQITQTSGLYMILREKEGRYGNYIEKTLATKEEIEKIEDIKERVAKKFSEQNKFFSHLQEITSKNTGHKKFTTTQILKMINCYDEFNNELGEVMSSAFDCVLVYPVIKTEVGEDVDIEALAIRESNVTAASTMIKIISKIDTSIERLHDLWTIDDDIYIKYKVILQEIFRDSRCVPDEFYPSELICTNPDLNAMKDFFINQDTGEVFARL